MASTAEELSSQADQLQATIAFFKVNGDGLDRAALAAPLRRTARQAAAPQIAHMKTAKAKPAAAAAQGIHLDLGQAGKAKGDGRDAEFEKF
jgi:methyl-accepting chemotaxis protein